METKTKAYDMLNAAQMFNNNENGQLVEIASQQQIMPTSAAVFAEPVIVAQPMQRNQKRNLPDFLNRMKVLAQMGGEDYRYSFPVKNKNGGSSKIEGGTIKMANDLVREYGNCMVDVRVIEQPDCHIFYARFVDYETGFCLTRAFRQRKGQKTIKTDDGRQEDIVFQIGQSKAIRNVVLNALGTFADFAYEEAKNSLVEKIGKDLIGWRQKIEEGCKRQKYDLKRIEESVARPIKDWVAVDIARVIAELKSISDGMTTFNDLYPDNKQEEENSAKKSKLDAFAGAGEAADAETGEIKPAGDDFATLNSLIVRLNKTPKEERAALFLSENGQELFEKAGNNAIAKLLSELGISVMVAA